MKRLHCHCERKPPWFSSGNLNSTILTLKQQNNKQQTAKTMKSTKTAKLPNELSGSFLFGAGLCRAAYLQTPRF